MGVGWRNNEVGWFDDKPMNEWEGGISSCFNVEGLAKLAHGG